MDDATLLMLHMDGQIGPFVPDASAQAAHGRLQGGASVVDVDAKQP
jgi:hypothetical protein